MIPTSGNQPFGLGGIPHGRATGGRNEITVTWTSIPGASYNLYWSYAPGLTILTGTKITGPTSGYVHGGLGNSTQVFYILTCSISGDARPSPQFDGTTLPPPAYLAFGADNGHATGGGTTATSDGTALWGNCTPNGYASGAGTIRQIEFTIGAPGANGYVGLADPSWDSGGALPYVGVDTHSYGINTSNGVVVSNGGNQFDMGPGDYTGNVVGIVWDSSLHQMTFYRQGVSYGTVSGVPATTFGPAFSGKDAATSVTVNSGPSFVHPVVGTIGFY